MSDQENEGLELFMSALSHPALLCNRDLVCIACNEAMCRSLALPRDKVIGHRVQDTMEPSAAKVRWQYARQVIESGDPISFEDTRGPHTFSIRMFPTKDSQGDVSGLALYAMDITKEKAAGNSAHEMELRFQRIIETCAEGVWQIDTENNTNFVNTQMANMLGYTVEEFMGKSMYDFMDQDAIAIAENNIKRRQQGIEETHPFRFRHKEGREVWTAMSTNPVQAKDGSYAGALAMVTDITKQRQLEQRLHQVKKLESLSALAGGVAHDINNVLSVILGNLELIKSNAGTQNPDNQSLIARILSATERATDLTSQMLAFSGRACFAAERLDLNGVTEEISSAFAGVVPSSTKLECQLAKEAPVIAADPAQIRQLINSLLTNASDAIGGANGDISISTGLRDVSQEVLDDTIAVSVLMPGEHAILRISDNGHGMSKETVGRLFEPFFSTRFAGRGLGMAVVLGILRSHRAGILVDSVEGEGTTLEILFPTRDVENLSPVAPASE